MKTNLQRSVVLLTVLFALPACGLLGDRSSRSAEELIGKWRLETFRDADGMPVALAGSEVYVAVFGEDNRFSGIMDCNICSAAYEAENGGRLSFEAALGCTKATCGRESHETIVKAALRDARRFAVDRERTLRIAFGDKGSLKFTYLGAPTLQGCYGTVCID